MNENSRKEALLAEMIDFAEMGESGWYVNSLYEN